MSMDAAAPCSRGLEVSPGCTSLVRSLGVYPCCEPWCFPGCLSAAYSASLILHGRGLRTPDAEPESTGRNLPEAVVEVVSTGRKRPEAPCLPKNVVSDLRRSCTAAGSSAWS